MWPHNQQRKSCLILYLHSSQATPKVFYTNLCKPQTSVNCFHSKLSHMGLVGSSMLTTSRAQLGSRLDGQPPEEKVPPPLHAHLSEYTATSDGILFSLGLGAEPQATIFTLWSMTSLSCKVWQSKSRRGNHYILAPRSKTKLPWLPALCFFSYTVLPASLIFGLQGDIGMIHINELPPKNSVCSF